MTTVGARKATRSVPRFSNLEELFSSLVTWRREGSSTPLFEYLRATWKPKSRRRTRSPLLQRSEEALKLLRRWRLVGANDSLETSCEELTDLFESDRDSFWLSLGGLVVERDPVFHAIHSTLLTQPLTKQEIANLWNPVTADVCVTWGKIMRLFFHLYEDKRKIFAVKLRLPDEDEVRKALKGCYVRLSVDSLGTKTEYVRVPALVNCAAFMIKVSENHLRAQLVRWAKERPLNLEFASAPRVSIERKGGEPIEFEGRTYYYVRFRKEEE